MSRRNTVEDFWKYVDLSGECWLWRGAKNRKGYGQFRLIGKLYISHRFIYAQLNGTIPEGMHVLHTCDTPSCVRPEHLFLGTNQDNVDDKMLKGRHTTKNRTHCKNGHEYTNDNTRVRPDGARQCRICDRENCRRSYERIYKNNSVRRQLRNLAKKKGGKDGHTTG